VDEEGSPEAESSSDDQDSSRAPVEDTAPEGSEEISSSASGEKEPISSAARLSREEPDPDPSRG